MKTMIRTSFGIVVVAFGLVAAPAGATVARLAVPDTAPLTVLGTHFKPHEHVRLSVVTSAGAGTRTLTAGEAGGFLTRFSAITLGTCASYTVRATGSLGSRAMIRVVPECANGPTQ